MGKKDKGDKGPGVSDLCIAAAAGNIGQIRAIIKEGVKIDKGDYSKRTALHLACAEGKLPVVRRLVDELHAKTNVVDSWGGTPLDDALRAGHQAISDFLLSKGAPVGKNAIAADDAGVLCMAGFQGNVGCIQGLKRRGVDVNTGDYDKRTAIHLAASEGRLEAVKCLVALKADLDPADRFGGTPLDDATRSNHREVMNYLKSKGASSGKGQAVSTQDAADLCDAASTANLDKLREIVKRGVNANAGDYDGRTAIHLAAAEGLKEVLVCLFDELEGNPNVVDRWGGTPYDDARRAGHKEVVDYLASKGAVRGKTSLHTQDAQLLIDAVMKEDQVCVRGLKFQNVDMNTKNSDKRTCLHIAAAEGKLDMVKFLIEEGEAEVNPKDRWSKTPYDDAVFFEHSDVISYLEEKGGESGRKKQAEGGSGKKKKVKKVVKNVMGSDADASVTGGTEEKAQQDDDLADKSTVAGEDDNGQDKLSNSSGDSYGSQKVTSWSFAWCTGDDEAMSKVMTKEIYVGVPATLQLRMKRALEAETRVKVTLSGPVILMGILDKQPPSTRCIELQFDVRLPGKYSLQATDADSGALLLQDLVHVLPSPKDLDMRGIDD
eukprot:gb/GFBE01038670.1/.p1 GENE.gb/GFBE01038670.1/~~gb/GFBE01038670.1/.p1  ORF type:complete len:603 (+),score=127.75 gb/GFBE01038670.1/:1-1809(+)